MIIPPLLHHAVGPDQAPIASPGGGFTKSIQVDKRPESVTRNLNLWANQSSANLDFSRIGKPTDNALVESIDGKVRIECRTPSGLCPLTRPAHNTRFGR